VKRNIYSLREVFIDMYGTVRNYTPYQDMGYAE
jgi:hypothetical protein